MFNLDKELWSEYLVRVSGRGIRDPLQTNLAFELSTLILYLEEPNHPMALTRTWPLSLNNDQLIFLITSLTSVHIVYSEARSIKIVQKEIDGLQYVEFAIGQYEEIVQNWKNMKLCSE